MIRIVSITAVALLTPLVWAADESTDLAAKLRELDTRVFSAEAAKDKQLGRMVESDIRCRIHAAHEREAKAFDAVSTGEGWEAFKEPRIKALRDSLGPLPPLGQDLKLRIARTYRGDGYVREDVVYESRPGLAVTANLYRPAKPPAAMPGIIIVHGFHRPKTQAELQDMGVTWAKLGCLVLVMDQLCHGERRQHPFADEKSYPGKFNLARQDYYSRANAGVQLSVAGESLMGWMAFDVMRGVDLLLAQPGIDKSWIVVLGAVAAGGDTAAVAAALDRRITVVVPFNFGGPEPETVYPLPADADLVFPYAVGGHWDSTRRLRNSARDGFLPWLVVGSIAPRRLVHAHEFAWDRPHDSAWRRLRKIFDLEKSPGNLAYVHGVGTLYGKPEGTGCANIGLAHRRFLYNAFLGWHQELAPWAESVDRRPAGEMQCLTEPITQQLKPQPVYQLAAKLGGERLAAARARLEKLPLAERRQALRRDWAKLLGQAEPAGVPKVSEKKTDKQGDVAVERIVLEVEPGIVVPLVLLLPPRAEGKRLPVVVGVAQHGKQEFLRQRAADIAQLLKSGVAVCLPDVRGTGETRADGDRRGPPAGSYKGVQANSNGTLLANEDLMLGRTLLGDRLRDLRSVLRFLKSRAELDSSRLALWGDSFAPVNGPDVRIEAPWDADKLPAPSEPLGGLLALFGGLFEDDLAISINAGLVSYASLLEGQFCFVPHDVIVPGALAAGDLSDVAAALQPRPLLLQGLVDGQNRRAKSSAADKNEPVAAWLVKQLK